MSARTSLHAETDADTLDREAAEWIVRLTGDDEAERVRAQRGFEQWRQSGAAQAQAGARMQALIERLQGLRDQSGGNARPARAAFEAAFNAHRKRARIRRALTTLVLLCACALPGWLVLQVQAFAPAYLLADLRSGTGQWLTRELPDGSRITLNSGSAVDWHYDTARRTVVLIRGEILVDVAKDHARPFEVRTEDGVIRALGTRFVVSRGEHSTRLGMIESAVTVSPADPEATSGPINAGQTVSFDRDGLGPVTPIDAAALDDAWRLHQLVVDNRPLTEVLEMLGRYRRGYIHYDRLALEGTRVSAVLPLDRPDEALRLLQATLPGLRIHTLTPYLALVDRSGVEKPDQARPRVEH